MPKIHELLAVEYSLRGQMTQVMTDLAATFSNKGHLFNEKRSTFQSVDEGRPPVLEAQSDIQSTVAKELTWVSGHIAKALDASYAIHVGNTAAKHDVEVNGEIILKDVPTAALLELEKEIKNIQALLSKIPTLDPAKGFTPDSLRGEGFYKAREVVKTRTKKEKQVLVLAPATDKHAAQVQVYDADVPIGTVTEQEWSAAMTPADKAALLDRCEELYRAIKKARMRANDFDVAVSQHKVGAALLGFILQKKIV